MGYNSMDDEVDEMLDGDLEDLLDEEEDLDEEIQYDESGYDESDLEKNKKILIFVIGIVVILAIGIIGVMKIGGGSKKDEQPQVQIEQTQTNDVNNPEDIQLSDDNKAQVGLYEEPEDEFLENEEDTQEEDLFVPSDSEEQETNSFNFPKYSEDAKLIEMDYDSMELYQTSRTNDYITLKVGDKNGSRAYINIDLSKYACNEELGKKITSISNDELKVKLDKFLNVDSDIEKEKAFAEEYITKYAEIAKSVDYDLMGYESDYKVTTTTKTEQEDKEKEEDNKTDNKNENKNSSSNSSNSNSDKKDTSSSDKKDTDSKEVQEKEYITIKYELNGGTNHGNNKSKVYVDSIQEFNLYNPTKVNYSFLGWYLDSDFNTRFTTISSSMRNITLYAKWIENLISVKGPSEVIVLDIAGSYNVKKYLITDPVDFKTGFSYRSSDEEVLEVTKSGKIIINGYGDCKISVVHESGKTTEISFEVGHTHDWQVKSEVKATCILNGKKTYECSICEDTKQEIISKTGHDFSKLVIDKEPTCIAFGKQSYHCSHCDALGLSKSIAKIDHDYSTSITQAATCTETGIKTTKCSMCNSEYTESIPAIGHDYEETTYIPPSSQTYGEQVFTCKNCRHSYSVIIDKLKY